jgi:hypothetical protein
LPSSPVPHCSRQIRPKREIAITTIQIGTAIHVTGITTMITTTAGDTLIRTIPSLLLGMIVSATGLILMAITWIDTATTSAADAGRKSIHSRAGVSIKSSL